MKLKTGTISFANSYRTSQPLSSKGQRFKSCPLINNGRSAKVKMAVREKTVGINDLQDIKPESSRWHAVYIGEGDINVRANDNEHCHCA